MGYGEVIGNESVHWEIVYEEKGEPRGTARGRDPIPFEHIGRNRKRMLTPGHFRVRMRFATQEAAESARKRAAVIKGDGGYFLLLDVPAVRRSRKKVEPPSPPAEVRVDW